MIHVMEAERPRKLQMGCVAGRGLSHGERDSMPPERNRGRRAIARSPAHSPTRRPRGLPITAFTRNARPGVRTGLRIPWPFHDVRQLCKSLACESAGSSGTQTGPQRNSAYIALGSCKNPVNHDHNEDLKLFRKNRSIARFRACASRCSCNTLATANQGGQHAGRVPEVLQHRRGGMR